MAGLADGARLGAFSGAVERGSSPRRVALALKLRGLISEAQGSRSRWCGLKGHVFCKEDALQTLPGTVVRSGRS